MEGNNKMAEKLNFYDLSKKKKFMEDKYKIEKRKGRRFAVAVGPSGHACWRAMGKA